MNMVESWVSDKKNLSKLKAQATKFTNIDEDKNDLVQETVTKMLLNKDKFQSGEGSNIVGWAYTILRNSFFDRNAKQKLLSQFPEEDNIGDSAGVSYNNGDGVSDVESLNQIIKNLPFDLKESLELLIIGFKYQEIADITEAPIGTIKNRIHMARKAVKQEIDLLQQRRFL